MKLNAAFKKVFHMELPKEPPTRDVEFDFIHENSYKTAVKMCRKLNLEWLQKNKFIKFSKNPITTDWLQVTKDGSPNYENMNGLLAEKMTFIG